MCDNSIRRVTLVGKPLRNRHCPTLSSGGNLARVALTSSSTLSLCSSSAIISAIALIALLTEADRRLKPVELEARGLDGFTRDNPSITKAVQLADWEHSAKMA